MKNRSKPNKIKRVYVLKSIYTDDDYVWSEDCYFCFDLNEAKQAAKDKWNSIAPFERKDHRFSIYGYFIPCGEREEKSAAELYNSWIATIADPISRKPDVLIEDEELWSKRRVYIVEGNGIAKDTALGRLPLYEYDLEKARNAVKDIWQCLMPEERDSAILSIKGYDVPCRPRQSLEEAFYCWEENHVFPKANFEDNIMWELKRGSKYKNDNKGRQQ